MCKKSPLPPVYEVVNNRKFVTDSMKSKRRLVFLIAIICMLPLGLFAKVDVAKYGVAISPAAVTARASYAMDSLVKAHPQLANAKVIMAVVRPHVMNDKTYDFYILLALCLALGIIRVINPKYFVNLWRAFRYPTLGK